MRRKLNWDVLAVVVLSVAGTAQAVTIDLVPVGNLSNANDTTGYGRVDYAYRMGKYEVTAGQYCEFLNAVADTDTYGLYDTYMNTGVDSYGCNIKRSGSSGSYSYSVAADWANRPVNRVSWGDAARFCNWLHNGQPVGAQGLSTTEDGAYFLNGATSTTALMNANRKSGSQYFIPTENEWYKAAYHKNNGVTGNYFDYATGSDSTPSKVLSVPSDPGNNATFGSSTIGSPYYRTEVGAHENSESRYGTYDQSGNVWEWNEAKFTSSLRGFRGGAYGSGSADLSASSRGQDGNPTREYDGIGFRVASVLPEMSKPDQASKPWVDSLPTLSRPDGSTAKNVVVLVHGLYDSDALFTTNGAPGNGDLGNTDMKTNIETALGASLHTDWDVLTYDWSADADQPGLPPPDDQRVNNALANGQNLADQIRANGYAGNIHFIAHSLGAKVIDVATSSLATKRMLGSSQGNIHETFLDAYTGVIGTTAYGWAALLGQSATWAEHYYDKETAEGFFGAPTASDLTNAHNVDITALLEDRAPPTPSGLKENHKWPVRWYDATIDGVSLDNRGYGFALSQEANPSGGWPPALEPGKTAVLTKTSLEMHQIPEGTILNFPAVSPAGKLINGSETGTVSATADSLAFGTGSPVWANLALDTDALSNFIEFDYQFTSTADGVLSVFVDGTLLGSFFERFARDGKYDSGMLFFENPLDPGSHVLGFRVDPLTDDQSLVTVSGIHAGFVVPEPCTLSLLASAALCLVGYTRWRKRA